MKIINKIESLIFVVNENDKVFLEVSEHTFKTIKELKQFNYLDKFPNHTILTDNQYKYLKSIKG